MRVADPENTITQQIELLRLLREGPRTRRNLSDSSGYSISLVRQHMQVLEANGLVVDDGKMTSDTRGRPSTRWSVDPDACLAVGLDVGGISMRIVAVDARGETLYRSTAPTPIAPTGDDLLRTLGVFVLSAFNALGTRRAFIRGLGISFSGFVDAQLGLSLDAANIVAAQQLPLQTYFHETIGVPIIVEDSSRAMAIAQMRYGAARGLQNFITINVGAGIGTGVVINGYLYRGDGGLAGELGHIPMLPDGAVCRCGSQGCLETLSSGSAIAARAQFQLEQSTPSLLHNLCHRRPETVTTLMVTNAARVGDKLAVEVLTEAGDWLGMATATAINLYSPRIVVFTGGVMRSNDLFLNIVEDAARRYILRQLPQPFPMVLSTLDDYEAALGAATLVIDHEFGQGFAQRLAAQSYELQLS